MISNFLKLPEAEPEVVEEENEPEDETKEEEAEPEEELTEEEKLARSEELIRQTIEN